MRFGVDEAGKGPVLGSMFVAAVAGPAGAIPDGVDDSKELAPGRREDLAGRIHAADALAVAVEEIGVDRIDDPTTDMNGLTVAGHAAAIEGILGPAREGVVDAGDTSAERFGRRVADHVDGDVELTARHGADAEDPHVAAASVVAKVARDAHVDRLAGEHGALGSGYPGDAATRTFLADYVAEHGELPPCARTSWATCEDVLAAAEQSALEEF